MRKTICFGLLAFTALACSSSDEGQKPPRRSDSLVFSASHTSVEAARIVRQGRQM